MRIVQRGREPRWHWESGEASSKERLWAATAGLAKFEGHVFHRELNQILDEAGFDRWVEEKSRLYYHERLDRRSIPPGACFRMILVGQVEDDPVGPRRGGQLAGGWAGRMAGAGTSPPCPSGMVTQPRLSCAGCVASPLSLDAALPTPSVRSIALGVVHRRLPRNRGLTGTRAPKTRLLQRVAGCPAKIDSRRSGGRTDRALGCGTFSGNLPG